MTRIEYYKLIPFFVFFTILTLLVCQNIFFWDTVQLGSGHAIFFYNSNFSSILLPDNLDSGHIPTFGAYLALMWKIFGKSLIVSHFAMLPVLIGIVIQAYNLLKKFINPKYIFFALTLFLADATFLAQATLVSPDIALAFAFLLGLNSILKYKPVLLSVSISALFLISMRGMMIGLGLLIIDIINNTEFKNFKNTFLQLLKKSIIYFPALIIFLAYSLYHFKIKGWIGYHENSPWAKSFERVDFMGFVRNIVILVWRFLDFGKIFIVFFILIICFFKFKNIFSDKKVIQIIIIFSILLICLSISFTTYKYLNGHRYILPLFLILSLLTNYLIFEKLPTDRIKKTVFSILLIGLLTGNLWIYPTTLKQGWDASLAYIPYLTLRNEMMQYTEQQNIKYTEVASYFPNLSSRDALELNGKTDKHTEVNFDESKYILYSNVYNLEEDDLKRLNSDFEIIKEFKKMRIVIRLYQKKSEE